MIDILLRIEQKLDQLLLKQVYMTTDSMEECLDALAQLKKPNLLDVAKQFLKPFGCKYRLIVNSTYTSVMLINGGCWIEVKSDSIGLYSMVGGSVKSFAEPDPIEFERVLVEQTVQLLRMQ